MLRGGAELTAHAGTAPAFNRSAVPSDDTDAARHGLSYVSVGVSVAQRIKRRERRLSQSNSNTVSPPELTGAPGQGGLTLAVAAVAAAGAVESQQQVESPYNPLPLPLPLPLFLWIKLLSIDT